MKEDSTDPMAEITAMRQIAEALASLDPAAIARVLRWAVDRYGAGPIARPAVGPVEVAGENGAASGASVLQSKDLAEFYAAASPKNEADKALVVGYWFQFAQGEGDFGSQAINSALKQLGHGVSNITSAFETLKAQDPALVMQLKKAGSTKQARKTYRLTAAGKSAVEQLIGRR